MNIACLDSSSQARINLQKKIEDCFEKCRKSSGFLPAHKTFPISFEELLLSSSTDAVILGPELSTEQAVSYIGEINKKLPDIHIIVFLKESNLSLFSLRRFEELASAVLTDSDSSIKVLHAIESIEDKSKKKKKDSKVIFLIGAKGGVGTTSLATALAHAAQNNEKRTLLVDLSQHSTLSSYLQTPRSNSSELAAFLQDSLEKPIALTEALVMKMIDRSANGLELLLPPSTKKDIRDLWLRKPALLDQNLAIFEILKNSYDLIIIDGAGAEGILPFSLISRSNHLVLISSSSPASVHLLNKSINDLKNVPGGKDLQIVINNSSDNQLQPNDIKNLIMLHSDSKEEEFIFHSSAIPFESRAKDWIGTGNSFYTESKKNTQIFLDKLLLSILDANSLDEELVEERQNLSLSLEQFTFNKISLNKISLDKLSLGKLNNLIPSKIFSKDSKEALKEKKLLTSPEQASQTIVLKKPTNNNNLKPNQIFNKQSMETVETEKLFKKASVLQEDENKLEDISSS